MAYTIKIIKHSQVEGEKYEKDVIVYEQRVEDENFDAKSVIKAVNRLETPSQTNDVK